MLKNIKVSEKLHKQLKMLAVAADMQLSDYVELALTYALNHTNELRQQATTPEQPAENKKTEPRPV